MLAEAELYGFETVGLGDALQLLADLLGQLFLVRMFGHHAQNLLNSAVNPLGLIFQRQPGRHIRPVRREVIAEPHLNLIAEKADHSGIDRKPRAADLEDALETGQHASQKEQGHVLVQPVEVTESTVQMLGDYSNHPELAAGLASVLDVPVQDVNQVGMFLLFALLQRLHQAPEGGLGCHLLLVQLVAPVCVGVFYN
jgi:hypothetical protein